MATDAHGCTLAASVGEKPPMNTDQETEVIAAIREV